MDRVRWFACATTVDATGVLALRLPVTSSHEHLDASSEPHQTGSARDPPAGRPRQRPRPRPKRGHHQRQARPLARPLESETFPHPTFHRAGSARLQHGALRSSRRPSTTLVKRAGPPACRAAGSTEPLVLTVVTVPRSRTSSAKKTRPRPGGDDEGSPVHGPGPGPRRPGASVPSLSTLGSREGSGRTERTSA